MYKCKHCNKVGKNAGGNAVHEKHCYSNPNRVERKRSPKAGAKKGCTPWNKGKSVGPSDVWKDKFPLESILVENSTYSRRSLKKRLIDETLLEYQCQLCGIGPVWNAKPMPLILDHINGVNNDNRIENLRFVCSNCDSQLPTYKSKNRMDKPKDSG